MFQRKEFGILLVPVMSMLCKKCGKELTQDAKFCLHCGEPVMPEENVSQQTEETKKKKGKAKFWLIGTASVLFVAGVLIAIFFADIAAWAERLILSPEKLMMKAFASVAQDAGFGDMGSGFSPETPRRYTMEIYMDEDIRQILSTTEDGDDTWLSDLNLQIVTGNEDDLRKTKMSLLVKETSIISLDVIQNAQKAWVGIPELSERYLEVVKEDLHLEQTNDLADKLPSGSEMAQMLRAYAAIWADNIHRVTKKNATLKIDGVSQNVLQLTATIRPDDAREALSQMAQKLKEDRTARKLLNNLAGEDIHTETANWLQTQAKSANLEMQLIAYLDDYNKLTGLELTDGDGRTLFYWAKTVSGGKYASRLACGSLTLYGKGTCSNGKKTGDCRLTVDDKTVLTYKLKNFSVSKKGFSGSVIFPIDILFAEPSAPGSLNTNLSLELSQTTVSGEEILSLNFSMDEKALVGLTFRQETMKHFSVDIPESVVPVSDTAKVEKWIQGLDWTGITQRLMDAGVQADALGSQIGE